MNVTSKKTHPKALTFISILSIGRDRNLLGDKKSLTRGLLMASTAQTVRSLVPTAKVTDCNAASTIQPSPQDTGADQVLGRNVDTVESGGVDAT